MTVGFLLPSQYKAASGIWRKILLQAESLRSIGVRVFIFSFSGEGSDVLKDHIHLPLVQGVSKEKQLQSLVASVIDQGVDVVYLRRELWHPSYRKLMRSVATIAEINTLERAEFRETMALPRRIYAMFTGPFWRNCPAGFVSMTQELAAAIPKRKPRAIISNGIAGPSVTTAVPSGGPHLFFSCTGSYSWHGIDKFVQMARMFPEWEFSFAGEFPDELRQNVPRNIKCHGKLSATDADQLLASANIGIGTLALHRKEMEEACPLKLRSYMAYGLPSIIGYKDTDFSGDFRFICQLPNTEDNVSANKEKIGNFVNSLHQQRVPWGEVSFASEAEKARLRCEFFQQVSEAWKRDKR